MEMTNNIAKALGVLAALIIVTTVNVGARAACDIPKPVLPNPLPSDFDPTPLAEEFCTALAECGFDDPNCVQNYLYGWRTGSYGGDDSSGVPGMGTASEVLTCFDSEEYFRGETTCSEVCGDGFCDVPYETTINCPYDCGSCGDGICDLTEDLMICSLDCNGCGDGICAASETGESCALDCVACGNSVCDQGFEDPLHCSADCGYCGDGICDSAEDAIACPYDCGFCGDGVCGQYEDCEDDCGNRCADGVCGRDEDPFTCAIDCSSAADGICDSEELLVCAGECAVSAPSCRMQLPKRGDVPPGGLYCPILPGHK